MDLSSERENVCPRDVQAQVDQLYAHILASVDVSLDDDAENSRSAVVSKKSLSIAGNTERRSRSQQSVARATERRSKLLLRGVCEEKNDAAVAAACCCCCCCSCNGGGESEGVDNISPSAALKKSNSTNITNITSTGVKNAVDGCSCSCHHSTLCCGANHTMQTEKEKRSAVVSCPKYMRKTMIQSSFTAALPHSLRRQPPSTFGSGRKGMSEPVKKNTTPGPGSYFCNDDNEVYEKHSGRVHRTGSTRGRSADRQETQKLSSIKEDAVEVLKRQFTLTCQCYWKQFPELEIPTNPSAHAATCPCQHLRKTSMKSNDSSRSSQTSYSDDSLLEVNNKKQRTHAVPVVISPRRGVRTNTKKMRGAVFGTSPRRTIFAEQQLLQQGEQILNERGKPIPQQGTKSIEKIDNISRSGKDSALRNTTTPSRKPLLGDVDVVPGPGAYNISSDFDLVVKKNKTRGVSIGRAARKLHTMTESPGPGAYSTDTVGVKDDQTKKKNYFLTTSPRRLQLSATKKEESGPGPGEYRTEKTVSLDARHKNAPAFSFGRAKLPECAKMLFRASPAEKVDDIPGPGTYDVSTLSRETGAPVSGRTAVITTSKRNDNMWRGVNFEPDDVPGPGTYTIEKEERGPAYSLRDRPTEHTETTPGPGQYMIPNESVGPQWTMSARRSSPEIKEPAPGPGDYFVPIYDLRREHSKAPLFTTAPRLLHADTDETAKLPGPGDYDIVSSIDVSRTAVIGTAARVIMPEGESSEIPGPGAYMVQHTTQEKRVTVPVLGTTSPRFENETVSGSVNPDLGPGYYDSDIHTTLVNQRSAILGSAPRTSNFISQAIATDAGPGSYEIVVPKDGPSFSIRQRLPDNSLQQETTPGPGLYDMHDLNTGRSAVVGSAARFQPNEEEKSSNEVPGPGAYTTVVPATSSSPAVFFGTSPRMLDPEEIRDNFNNNNNNNLGPGDYDPQDIRGNISGAAWGKDLRFTEDDRNTEVPGPGAYDILSFSPVRNVVFGTAGEKSDWLVPSDTSDLPGPGSYLPQDPKERGTSTVVFGSSPQHTLSPEEREKLLRTNLGPGAYDAILPTPHAFHASFGNTKAGRTEEIPLDLTPGPGQYSPDKANILPSRAVVFGTASRNQLQGEGYDIPGPGAYAPMDASNGIVQSGPVTFPTAARFGNTELGGGDNGNKSDTPGPGAYFVERYMEGTTSGGAVVIGTGPRVLDQEQRERAQFPGPGQYKLDDNITMTRTSVYTFPTEPRMAMNEGGGYSNNNNNMDVPGPGAYDVAVPTFTAPTTRFGTEERKMVPPTLAEVPGPGAYDINGAVRAISSAGPSYMFPTASRELPTNSGDTPGPGQYESNLVETFSRGDTKAPSFPTGPRFSEVKNDNLIPGPGQYTPNHPQWEASKVYSFSTGSKQQPLNDEMELPGPGTYSPNQILPSSVAPSFGTEPRRIGSLTGDFGNVNNNNNNIPGPGYYNVTLPPTGPAVSFGVAPRVITQNNNDEGAPGPGTYDVIPKAPEGPAVSLHRTAPRGLTLVEMENSHIPGPGAYSLPSVFPATEGSGAAISFLKAERFQIPESTEHKTPGPGFYSPQYLDQTTGCFIGRAPRMAEVSDGGGRADIPGPGHYEVYRQDTNFETSVDGGVAMRFTASRFAGNGEGNISDIPGPASYNISETLNTGNAISFPQAARFVVSELNNAAMQPGPGEYSIPSSWQQQQLGVGGGAVSYSFGTSTRMDPATAARDTPGPGSYDASRYAERFMAGPAFTLHGKPTYVDEKETVDYPGPGAYCPRPVETVRTTNFGVPTTVDSDAVFAAHVNSTPGPGTYVIPQTLSQQTVTFGTAERMTEVKEDHPGPGAYLTGGPIIVPSQPTFSFGNAPRQGMVSSTQSNLPGPGEYHHPIDPKPSVPAFTFAGAERFNDMEKLGAIGPGQYYNVGTAGSYDGQAYSFPTALRTVTTATATSTGNIGPGEYFHPHRWELAEHGPTFPIQDASTSTNNRR